MSFDSVFHGNPSSTGGQSVSSGRASLGIDVTAGVIYFRTPENGGWIPIVGGSGGSGSGVPNNPASVVETTGNYQPALTDGTILANGTLTVTLVTSLPKGTTFRIKNVGTGTVTISGPLDGGNSYPLNPYQYQSIDVQYDGVSSWWIL
jgi:hypothetical protein